MEYRDFGRTGLKLSALGFGGSPLGGGFGDIDEAEAIRAVQLALELGVNYFDTAPLYGDSRAETVLGRALRGVPRDEFILSTKVGRYGPDFDYSAERVKRGLDESLQRLGVDRVDLLICHDVEFAPPDLIFNETIPAVRELVVAGKARFAGVSGLPLSIYRRVLAATDLDFILSYCHYTLYNVSLMELLPELTAREIGVISASPLGMGLLSPAGPPSWHPAPSALKDACVRARDWCFDRDADIADIALEFALDEPRVASVLVGMADSATVRRNVLSCEERSVHGLAQGLREIFAPVRNATWPSGLPEWSSTSP